VIKRTLETEIVKERLKTYGLTSDEINARLQDLTGERIHLLAQASTEKYKDDFYKNNRYSNRIDNAAAGMQEKEAIK
jgi:chorismate mutase